jgi:hypothetical protein
MLRFNSGCMVDSLSLPFFYILQSFGHMLFRSA